MQPQVNTRDREKHNPRAKGCVQEFAARLIPLLLFVSLVSSIWRKSLGEHMLEPASSCLLPFPHSPKKLGHVGGEGAALGQTRAQEDLWDQHCPWPVRGKASLHWVRAIRGEPGWSKSCQIYVNRSILRAQNKGDS